MKRYLILILLVLPFFGTSQNRPIRFDLANIDTLTTAQRNAIPASAGQAKLIFNIDSEKLEFRTPAGTWAEVGSGGVGASQLSDLSDVNTSTPTNRNVLVADGTDWESRALLEADISDFGTYVETLADLGVTASATELNYTDGVTSNIQTQLDSKLGSGDNVSELVNDAGYIIDADVGGIVASGTQSLTASSTNTVTHSLGYAPDPSRIMVTAYRTGTVSATSTTLVVGNITSTTFDVPVGSFTDPMSISWAIFGSDNATPMTGSEIKTSLDTEIANNRWDKVEVPGGGTAGQVLEKADGTDYNVQWATPASGTDDQTAAEVSSSPTGNIAATNVDDAIAELEDEKLASISAGRTNEETYSNVIGQPYDDSVSDGAPPAGTLILEFEVPPAILGTGTTADMDDYMGYNTGSASAATSYTVQNVVDGGFSYFLVNAASEPTISGTGITVEKFPGTEAFINNEDMWMYVWAPTATLVHYWFKEKQ